MKAMSKISKSKWGIKNLLRNKFVIVAAIFIGASLMFATGYAINERTNRAAELRQAELKKQQDQTAKELQELKDKQALEAQSNTPPATQNQPNTTTQAPQKTTTQNNPKPRVDCTTQQREFEKITTDNNNAQYNIYLREKQRILSATYAPNEEWLRDSDIQKIHNTYSAYVDSAYLNAKAALEGMGCSTSNVRLLYYQPR